MKKLRLPYNHDEVGIFITGIILGAVLSAFASIISTLIIVGVV